MRRLAPLLIGAGLLAAGCVSFLPLPLSPIAIMTKQFPVPVEGPGVARAYTIKNDTFAYPDLNLSITRPPGSDALGKLWQFTPGTNAVTVQLRNGLTSTEPVPQLLVQLVAVDSSQVETLEVQDLPNFARATLSEPAFPGFTRTDGTAVPPRYQTLGVRISPRFVAGQPAQLWTRLQTDPGSQLQARLARFYVNLPNILVQIQATAEPFTFDQLTDSFASMVSSVTLPPLDGATPVPVSPVPVIFAGNIQGDQFQDPSLGVGLMRADNGWQWTLGGAYTDGTNTYGAIGIYKPGVVEGLDPPPEVSMITTQAIDADVLRKLMAQNMAAAKLPVQVTQVQLAGGVVGEQWRFNNVDTFGKLVTTRRVFARNAKGTAILEATSLATDEVLVQDDFAKMIASITLPAGDAKPFAALDGGASGAASPAATGAAK